MVSTLAGTAGVSGYVDGTGTNAMFNLLRSVAIDPTGAYALVYESKNWRIRRIVIASGLSLNFISECTFNVQQRITFITV